MFLSFFFVAVLRFFLWSRLNNVVIAGTEDNPVAHLLMLNRGIVNNSINGALIWDALKITELFPRQINSLTHCVTFLSFPFNVLSL